MVHRRRLHQIHPRRSACALVALPKSRFAEAVEKVHAPFDFSITAEFSHETLATLPWVLTRIKPSVKICDLMVTTYDQLGDLLVKANRRLVVNMHHVKHGAMLGALRNDTHSGDH